MHYNNKYKSLKSQKMKHKEIWISQNIQHKDTNMRVNKNNV